MKMFLKPFLLCLVLTGVSSVTISAAHADYYYNHRHYKHRVWVKDRNNPKGHYWRYY
jgi:hypothetical protein